MNKYSKMQNTAT